MPSIIRYRFLQIFFAASLALCASASFTKTDAQDRTSATNQTIVFVCLHGSVRSQMAAAYFNRIAKERGLPFTAISRGIQVDSSIPMRIRDGLAQDGLAPTDDIPHGLTADEASGASKVFAFDAVPDDRKGAADITYWSDVPTKDYQATREAIVRHIDGLLPTLGLFGRLDVPERKQ
jgi:Protein-tyrosine-phosphatase